MRYVHVNWLKVINDKLICFCSTFDYYDVIVDDIKLTASQISSLKEDCWLDMMVSRVNTSLVYTIESLSRNEF